MSAKSANAKALDSNTKQALRVMTKEQEDHLQRVKDQFTNLVDVKYRLGQGKHGGDLFHNSTVFYLDAAIAEAIDQVVYLLTLREHILGQQ